MDSGLFQKITSVADASYRTCTFRSARSFSHSHTARVTLCSPSNPSQRGITLWEHTKPVNLENNTSVIHVSTTLLNKNAHACCQVSSGQPLHHGGVPIWMTSEHGALKQETDTFPSISFWLLSVCICCTVEYSQYNPGWLTVPNRRLGLYF